MMQYKFFILVLLTSITNSFATPVSYSDQNATDVIFQNIQEEALTAGDGPTLLGSPAISGNTIEFDPVGFSSSITGASSDKTECKLNVTIQAKLRKSITSIAFVDSGDVTLAGFGGTDNTSVSVTTFGVLRIREVNGTPISPITVPITLVYSPAYGSYGLLSQGLGGPLYMTSISGSANINVDTVLSLRQISGHATKIEIELYTRIFARSEVSKSASVLKKDPFSIAVTP